MPPDFVASNLTFVEDLLVSGTVYMGQDRGTTVSPQGELQVSGTLTCYYNVDIRTNNDEGGQGAGLNIATTNTNSSFGGSIARLAGVDYFLGGSGIITAGQVDFQSRLLGTGPAVFTGGLQMSGAMTTYGPIYGGAPIGGQRYVTSGEMRPLDAVGQLLDRQVTLAEVGNTAAATAVYSYTMPGGTLGTSEFVDVNFWGAYRNNNVTPRDVIIMAHYGGQQVASGTFASITASVNERAVVGRVRLAGAGATNRQWGQATGALDATATTSGSASATAVGGAAWNLVRPNLTVDATADQPFVLSVAHDTAATTQVFKLYAVSTVKVTVSGVNANFPGPDGDFIKAQANYATGSPQVFGPDTAVQFSGLVSFGAAGGTRVSALGEVQLSGLLNRGYNYLLINSRGGGGASDALTGGLDVSTVNGHARFGSWVPRILGYDYSLEGSGLLQFFETNVAPLLGGGAQATRPIYSPVEANANRLVSSGEVAGHVRTLDRSNTVVENAGDNKHFEVYSYTVPANTLGTAGQLELGLRGAYRNATGTTHQAGVMAYYGATCLFSGVVPGLLNNANDRYVRLDLTLGAAGTTGAQRAHAQAEIGTFGVSTVSGQAVNAAPMVTAASHLFVNEDSTTALALRVAFMTSGSSVGAARMRKTQAWVRYVP